MDALPFLQAVAGYTRSATDGSADRPIRLAVINPAHVGTGLPRVTFEGESTLSVKTYPYVESYLPAASDRVVMFPVGNTYLIGGAIDDATSNLVSRVAAKEADLTGTILALKKSQVATTLVGSGVVGSDTQVGVATFTAVAGRCYRVRYKSRANMNSTAATTIDHTIKDAVGNGSVPTTASTTIAGASIVVTISGGPGSLDLLVEETLRCGPGLDLAAGIHNLLACYQRTAGGAGVAPQPQVSPANQGFQFRELSVMDCGLNPP